MRATELHQSMIGRDVWVAVAGMPTVVCHCCGAPNQLCGHTDQWRMYEIPALRHGVLQELDEDDEHAAFKARIDDAWVMVRGMFQDEESARAWLAARFGEALNLLCKWSTHPGCP